MKTLEQLSKESLRTDQDVGTVTGKIQQLGPLGFNLMHSALGLTSESGEFASAVKAYIVYGRTLDLENLEEELGDIWWFFNKACKALGTTPERIIQQNIEKLKIRYPEKYTDADALERKDKIEHSNSCECQACKYNMI